MIMEILPVDIVLHPSWWYHQTGLTFDEDFFFHPKKRVEAERQMERTLYERWGQYGLGQDHATDRPHIGAVHLAAGFLLSEMLGCRIEYQADAAPQVIEAHLDAPDIKLEQAFNSYERYLLPFDIEWSRTHRPYGIHYCGSDPHRYAEAFAKIPHLDFLDVGWGAAISNACANICRPHSSTSASARWIS
jgi:hypothetical protein